ncbi:hypothetical protein F5146DRAFT_1073926 [Armillaria mellea]|nr:hypothetical protein F5146DRAFT_1073926 [Armillaria mellea]
MTSDPKAIQHVLRTSGYRYPKTKDVAHMWDMLIGRNLVTVAGSVHRRQWKLSPAFSSGQLKVYMSAFHATGVEVSPLITPQIKLVKSTLVRSSIMSS